MRYEPIGDPAGLVMFGGIDPASDLGLPLGSEVSLVGGHALDERFGQHHLLREG